MVHVGWCLPICPHLWLLGVAKRALHLSLGHSMDLLVIEAQPLASTLHQRDVMPVIHMCPHVHHHGGQRILCICIWAVLCGVGELQVKREHHPVRQLPHLTQFFYVLEPFQVQAEHRRQSSYPHALLRLLLAATRVAGEFIFPF